MRKADVLVRKVEDLVEELAGLIIDDEKLNDYFVELYGMEAEDNPVYYAAEYCRDMIIGKLR
jgi:hypothetical protein